jgi:BirA family biotin operon repressor/biotin-[acetyl-CoA-carboxylase] ligase
MVGAEVSSASATKAPGAILTHCPGWTLHDYEVVDSTNLVAARLPAWNAVRARRQTAGRGRYQRSWISDAGGLWLSAVVPVASAEAGRVLPLLAGLALTGVFESLNLETVRMRWPNDLLVGRRKLSGILVDSFCPQTAVVGIGVNVDNHPESCEPSLSCQAVRLADLLQKTPTLGRLTSLVLQRIRDEIETFSDTGSVLPTERVNQLWRLPREVELDLDGQLRRGTFTGVDQDGRLGLWAPDGTLTFYAAHQVRHLTEIES